MVKVGYGVKLWLTNEKGESIFGDGLAELLEEIDKRHSLLETTKYLGMSYRYALHRITLAEARFGSLLVTRVHGGAKGGGRSEVTELGKELVLKYRSAQAKLDEAVKELP